MVTGMPAPVKLGLAGGPLLVAILLSRLGRVGPLVFYLPISANFMLREIGIALFLAAVGLRSGAGFVETLVKGPGLTWMAIGAVITIVPILVVGAIGRLVFRVNFLTLTGVMILAYDRQGHFSERVDASEAERAAAYETWLHHYNHHRPHTGIGGQTPSARVHNVTGKFS